VAKGRRLGLREDGLGEEKKDLVKKKRLSKRDNLQKEAGCG
jgi:hypothetical protein